MPPEYLIVGLGNPGREYRYNRHNVGFMLMDRLAAKLGTRFTRKQGNALVTTATLPVGATVAGRPQEETVAPTLALAKPQGYMNLSGGPVASLLKFYRLPFDRLLVCYDELDLPTGTIRLRAEGGSAGHNGMKSIIERLGTPDFARLRLGIGRPPGSKGGANYVLSDVKGEEADIMNETLDRAVSAIETFVREGIVAAMNKYNEQMNE